jgi:mannose-6-phosphate isomerase-like protein (cupin superfamily)
MNYFIHLSEVLRPLRVNPSTGKDRVKRMSICNGAFVTANIATGAQKRVFVHTQPSHDDIVIVLEGEADLRVGDEVQHVGPGHIVFIPCNKIHGRVRTATQKQTAFSIYAPFFDRSKKNIVWEGRGERLPASSGAENQPQ